MALVEKVIEFVSKYFNFETLINLFILFKLLLILDFSLKTGKIIDKELIINLFSKK